jgi:hypothetical protein
VPAVFLYEGLEHGPLHAADEAACFPYAAWQALGVGKDLFIEERHRLLHLAKPLVPVLEHARPLIPFFSEQLDAVVQLPHAFGNLLGRLWLPHAGWGQRGSVQVLLESAIKKGPQQARADFLPGQPPQHVQLVLPVDQVLHLGPVDPQQNFGRLFLAGLPRQ